MPKEKQRCTWAGKDPLMIHYHDTEWGVPLHDSRALWELLMLEGFQAGLSWSVVLRKRENFREAFLDFDPRKVAKLGEPQIQLMLANPGIIRSRAKIESTIKGAQLYLDMGSKAFHDLCWSFTEGRTIQGDGQSFPVTTPAAEKAAKELKRRGFKFVGPAIIYAWMQAAGMVNDHSTHCFRRAQV